MQHRMNRSSKGVLAMRRFDLLDEYASVAVPKFSSPRARPPHLVSRGRWTGGHWRYGMAGVIAILLVALVAF
jgi:hypothetical protein